MHFKVDKNVCIGCGQCINTCEQVFDWDDDGLAKVITDDLSDEVIETAKEAMEFCPVNAISLDE